VQVVIVGGPTSTRVLKNFLRIAEDPSRTYMMIAQYFRNWFRDLDFKWGLTGILVELSRIVSESDAHWWFQLLKNRKRIAKESLDPHTCLDKDFRLIFYRGFSKCHHSFFSFIVCFWFSSWWNAIQLIECDKNWQLKSLWDRIGFYATLLPDCLPLILITFCTS